MQSIPKVSLFSLVVALISYLPLLTALPDSNSDLKAFRTENRDSIRIKSSDENVEGYAKWLVRYKLARRRAAPVYNLEGAPFSLAEQKAVKTLVDDFLVNDDPISPNWQCNPAAVQDPFGNFIITWQDERNGNNDIYAQRYDSSGIALGSNFKVNDDTAGADQWFPAIGMDGSGNFIIAWRDERDGNQDIYAQRYDSSGAPIGSDFKVNDDADSANQDLPAIASDAEGNLVIAWQDERNGDYDIYAQRYDSTGTPLGANFKVSDDIGTAIQVGAAIAVDGSGNFIITWYDHRSNNWDIYAQRYDSSGNPLGANFKVNDDIFYDDQCYPAIAVYGSGNFIITWQDARNGSYDIYVQRYDSSGTPLGSNFKVNDDSGPSVQDHPAIAVDGSANFIITWCDKRNGNQDIYAQRYDSSATALGVNFKVNDDPTATYQRNPAVAADSAGNFIITWEDWRNGIHFDIYVQRYDSSGTPLSINFMVNDDVGYARQDHPDIAIDGDGNFVITWKDYRFTDYGDIFAQRYDSSGIPLGSNFPVNDNPGAGGCNFPAVAADNSGNFVVTWEGADGGTSYPDLFARRYDASGTPLGPSFKVNDDIGDCYQIYPAIATDRSGNFVIAWVDDRHIDFDIFAQRFDSSGTPQGANFEVNGDDMGAFQFFPAVAMDEEGNFIIAWIDNRMGDDDIVAKRYNPSGQVLNSDFRANDVPGSALFPGFITPAAIPAITTVGGGNFVIAWTDERNETWWPDIYAQRYNSYCTRIGTNFRVNDDSITVLQWSVSIASDGRRNFIITWADDRNDNWDIYAQKFDSSGTPLGNNYFVPNPQYASFGQEFPEVVANKSNIYFTWMDDRRDGNWDIYAKMVEGDWPIIRGDANDDGVINSADIVYLINYLFKGGPAPDPLWVGDVNCDEIINSADVVYLIDYLFKGGPPPAC